MKLAVVGAGSTYTPELLRGLGELGEAIGLSEVTLEDVDAVRLEVVGGASERVAAAHGFTGHIERTTDLERAVDGADFVVIQIRVGGQAARHLDETLPLAFGRLGQETTGAGGLAKALRTVPVVLEIAERVRRGAAPGAWIIDFTNPVGIVTRALLDAGHRALGLCNVAVGFQRQMAGWLGVTAAEVELGHAGLNHLTWIRSVGVGGVERIEELLESHGDDLAERVGLPRRLLERLHAIPSPHLRYYYRHDAVVAELHGRPSRAEAVAAIKGRLLDLYRDPDLAELPPLLSQRGGAHYSEAALELIAALAGGGGRQVVDVRNGGAIRGLPDDAVVEVPALIGRDGAQPLSVPALPPHMAGLVAHVEAYERLAAGAARSGDRDLAVTALLTHPLVGQIEVVERLAAAIQAHQAAPALASP
jgi:6-phospho-beta-glucosidase